MNSAQLLLYIVNDLLDLFRIKNKKFVKNESEVNIRQEVNDVIELFDIQAAGKGISLTCDVNYSVPTLIHIDMPRIKQVLVNLLGNAIKFTQRGYVKICITVVGGNELLIEVVDSGTGIKEED